MKYFFLCILALLPLLLGASLEAEIIETGSIETDFYAQYVVMDTDSTLCLYNFQPYQNANGQQITLKRLSADGTESEQVIHDFHDSPSESGDFHEKLNSSSNSFLFFGNTAEIALIHVNGFETQEYYLPLEQINYASAFYFYINEDQAFFMSSSYDDGNSYHYLWKWDYQAGTCTNIFDASEYFGNPHLTKFGDRFLISEETPNGLTLIVLFDSELNPTFYSSYDVGHVLGRYKFDENTYFGDWWIGGYGSACGVIYFGGDEPEFNTWTQTGMYEPWSEGYGFIFGTKYNIHGAWYSFSGMYESYRHIGLYDYLGDGSVVAHQGFPDLHICPHELIYANEMHDRIILVYFGEGSYIFHLADIQESQWIDFVQNQWQPQQDYAQITSTRFYGSDEYQVLKITTVDQSENIHVRYHFLKVELSISNEDLVNSPPALVAYPNPFSDQVKISSEKLSSDASLQIYNLRGQKVRSLYPSSEGYIWDGKDDRGQNLSSGVYFAREANQAGIVKVLKLAK